MGVCCAAFEFFKNKTPVKYIFIENHPTVDSGPDIVQKFLVGKDGVNIVGNPPPAFDGRAHSYGLSLAFPRVDTEWTLFMDADTVPLKDGWLDELMAYECDMVGPHCDSGLNDYTLPILHPCLLLFRTAVAKPPYWDMFFGSWGDGQVKTVSPAGGTWDTCRPFTYHIGINKSLKQKTLANHYCQDFYEGGKQVYFLIGDRKNPLAFHAREGSQSLARHQGDARYLLLARSPLFSWYKGPVEKPCTKFGR